MDEIFGRRDMIAPVKLKALSVKSDWRGFGQVGAQKSLAVVLFRGEDRPQKLARARIVIDHHYPQSLHTRN